MNSQKIILGSDEPLTLEEVNLISSQLASVELNETPKFVEMISAGPKLVEQLVQHGHVVYSVNTGIGSNATNKIPVQLRGEFGAKVIDCYGVSFGAYFDKEQTRAILVARILSLARGFSGVRIKVLSQMSKLLQEDILPQIPQEGSVGASGDLAPLSYVAAVLCGKRNVIYNGEVKLAAEVFKNLGISPLILQQKEGIALINRTSVMTGVACLALLRADYICKLVSRITSLAILVINGNLYHYDRTLFLMKSHPGQQLVASRIRDDLVISDAPESYCKMGNNVQDRYSIRCAPQVIGVLADARPFFKRIIEAELNSANDNPLFDIDTNRAFHGGVFYGGHIAFAMDSLKCLVANLADLMDRQMALLMNPAYNNGLPPNLSGAAGGPRAVLNHGLKGLEIVTSGWTAEALKGTMPASVFSRSIQRTMCKTKSAWGRLPPEIAFEYWN